MSRAVGLPRPFRALVRDASGVTSVEFALVIGLIIMIVIGTIEFGRALAAQNEMSYALGRVVRVTTLDSSTTTEEVVALLEDQLDSYDERELEVAITEVSGTSFMEIAVEFPFTISIPLMPVSEVMLRVATRAPMVSPTQ
jgi:Flp pilus assembly protein TadG